MRLFYLWRGLGEWRAESCTVELGEDGLHARGVQIAAGHRLRYELTADSALITRMLSVRAHTPAGEHGLLLEHEGAGEWTADGVPLPYLSGALDCDLALSPLTNHMPAGRLRDEPADHVMAWVDVPSLEVLRSEQRYEPAGPGRVRFVGLEDGFTAELELDEHGFVTATRAWPRSPSRGRCQGRDRTGAFA